MSKRMLSLLSIAAIMALSLTVMVAFSQAHAQSATPAAPMAPMGGMNGFTKAMALTATSQDGTPTGIDKTTWDKAFGVAEMIMGNSGEDSITVLAGGLVPNGLYTAWWVNTKPSMTTGPLTKADNNSFTADANGYGTMSFTVPSKNDYQTIFLVYHPDGKTHGDTPGKLGSDSYSQLSGEFPGPAGAAAAKSATGMGSSTTNNTMATTEPMATTAPMATMESMAPMATMEPTAGK